MISFIRPVESLCWKGWTWFATEGSSRGDDFLFFGYVIGIFPERGYFVLSELESVRRRFNLPVERDLYFTHTP